VKRFVWHFAADILIAGLLTVGALAAPQAISAGALSTNIVAMFPKQVGEFSYTDLKSARKLAWFPQLQEQILPSRFREFEQFISSAGIDPGTQIDEMAWGAISPEKGGGSEEIVGVAIGSFDPSAAEDHFKQQKLPMTEVHGFDLYAFGTGSGDNDILFTFIDSNTAAFGSRLGIEKLIDVRTGVAESLLTNDQLFPLINEANGTGLTWTVLDHGYTRLAVEHLLPEANQFPQAAAIVNRLQAMIITIKADSGMDAQFQAVCNSTDDANLLGSAFQAVLLYKRYTQAKDQADLASLLDGASVTPSGDRVRVEVSASQEQLTSLITNRVLAAHL
jgi:hypothetical protein